MAQLIKWSLTVDFPGGDKVASANTVSVEAFDSIKVSLDAASSGTPSEKPVEVQPGTDVKFLLITSSKYDASITVQAQTGPDPSPTTFGLETPLMFASESAVEAMGEEPKDLVFKNALEEEVNVQIYVGRDI